MLGLTTSELEDRERAQMFIDSKLLITKARLDDIILGDLESIVDSDTVSNVIESYEKELSMLEYIKESIHNNK